MRARRWVGGLLAVALVLVLAGCASAPRDGDDRLTADAQWAEANRLYEEGSYREAVERFQAFTLNYPQDPRAVDARWLAAESYYGDEDWATAALEYLNFQRDHPRDPRAAGALLQAGKAYQRMSLRPELDQSDTRRAINVYQRLIAEYPGADESEEARQRFERLRDKLAEKVYLNAEFYFDNETYRAAEIYLEDLITEYTDTAWLPAGYALLAKTFCAQGLTDRAGEAYDVLRQTYPESRAAARLEEELGGACRSVETESEG